MDVQLTRIISVFIVVSALLGAPLGNASDTHSRSPDDAVALLALAKMEETAKRANEVFKDCGIQERSRVLPGDLLDGLGLSNEEARSALLYFYAKTGAQCVHGAAKEFLAALYLVEEAGLLDKGYKADGIALSGDSLDLAALVMTSHWMELENDVVYRQLPSNVREMLESMEDLRTPFNLGESAQRLGLIQ